MAMGRAELWPPNYFVSIFIENYLWKSKRYAVRPQETEFSPLNPFFKVVVFYCKKMSIKLFLRLFARRLRHGSKGGYIRLANNCRNHTTMKYYDITTTLCDFIVVLVFYYTTWKNNSKHVFMLYSLIVFMVYAHLYRLALSETKLSSAYNL